MLEKKQRKQAENLEKALAKKLQESDVAPGGGAGGRRRGGFPNG